MISSFDLNIQKEKIDQIFQVSINSKKLIAILKRLEENNLKLNQKMQRIDQFYKEGDIALNNKINNTATITKTIINQELDQIKIQLQVERRKYEQKYIKQLNEKDLNLNELKYSVQALNDKINKVNSTLTEEMQNTIRNLSSETFSLRRTFQTSQEQVQSSLDEILGKLQAYKTEIKNNKDNNFDMEIKLRRFTQFLGRPVQADTINSPDKRFQDSYNSQKYSQLNQTGPFAKFQPKDFMGMSHQSKDNYMSTLQYASISAKVESLEKTIQQNASKGFNDQKQFLSKRGGKKRMMKTISFSKEDFQKSLADKNCVNETSYEDMEDSQIIAYIFKKFETVERTIQSKEKNLKKQIEQFREKKIINEEKIQFNKQKITKIISDIAEIKIKLLGSQKKTGPQIDKISIVNIQNQIGKIIQRLDNQFQNKLNLDEYTVDKTITNQKLRILQENLIFKADKEDVKKAINFLEEKIKEIILVMANEFNDQKVGAISKQPVKCLTCDKEVFIHDNKANTSNLVKRGMTSPKSSSDLQQKYHNRILKLKKTNRPSSKRILLNYTSATQFTEQKEQFMSFGG